MKISLFSGGRGSNSILKSILLQTNFQVQVGINGYDNGLSTGRLREYLGGFLGPSDFRKNLSIILDCLPEMTSQSTGGIFEHRISKSISKRDISVDNIFEDILEKSRLDLNRLPKMHHTAISDGINSFLEYHKSNPQFEFEDCAVGNLVIAGYFLNFDRNFNLGLKKLQLDLLLPERVRLVNCTDGQNAYLKALSSEGEVIQNEWEIVQNLQKYNLEKISLFPSFKSKNISSHEFIKSTSEGCLYLNPNQEFLEYISSCDVIIYGPGTPLSSLLPTYFTNKLANTIKDNRAALKIYVNNIKNDNDIPFKPIETAYVMMMEILEGNLDSLITDSSQFVTDFLTGHENSSEIIEQIVLQSPLRNNFSTLGTKIVKKNWQDYHQEKHLGNMIIQYISENNLNEIKSLVKPKFISVVIPCLNEEKLVTPALESLQSSLETLFAESYEMILVDGGSNDRTLDAISRLNLNNLIVLKCMNPTGRGEAIIKGISEARGDIISIFPADNEYSASDFVSIIQVAITNNYEAVWCSRTTSGLNLKESTLVANDQKRFKGWVSLWGGFLLTIICFFKLNRLFSDPLSIAKIFRKETLDRINLNQKGVEFEVELIFKVFEIGAKIIEFPIAYSPRNKSQGKKISLGDGIRCIKYAVFAKVNI